jgi:hypothetical protein
MGTLDLFRIAGAFGLAVLPTTHIVAAAAGLPLSGTAQELTVRVYETVAISPSELESARTEAKAVFDDAGVALRWRTCAAVDGAAESFPNCDDPIGPTEVIVRILDAAPRTPPSALGDSLITVDHRDGSLATVYADRVELTARSARIPVGVLLGRTIAHEIGHLILGTTEHPAKGLMRANWSGEELLQNRAPDWVFSKREKQTIAQHLRTRAANRPEGAGLLAVVH